MEIAEHLVEYIKPIQSNASCVLQQKCEKHLQRRDDGCSDCWILIPEVHDFLHRLPGELQRMVIAETITPPAPCVKYMFGHCDNQWNCKAGTHIPDPKLLSVTPSQSYMLKCQLIHDEGYKAFFKNNVFIFDSWRKFGHRVLGTLSLTVDPETLVRVFRGLDYQCRNWRDPQATRLLDFVDVPEWKGRGSDFFQRNVGCEIACYDQVDKYRYSIRHLVIKVYDDPSKVNYSETCIWGWALKIDWSTLPDLQTLDLDLRSYSYRQIPDEAFSQEYYDEQLEAGAKRMACLNLKNLTLYGLCSGPEYWGKQAHKQRIEDLFQPALANGKPELVDEQSFTVW